MACNVMSASETRDHRCSSVSGRSIPGGFDFDELALFQAAPLVWKDDEGQLHPISMFDFDREYEMLADSVAYASNVDAKIDLIFETGTTERLGAFMATSEAKVIHFSCHGYPDRLCFEDGTGGTQFLEVEELREFMSTTGAAGQIRFVFVSACHSRAAGEAFVKAGVPHVLCCRQEMELMDVSTVEFARNFYRALSCGKRLQKAFDLGQQAVKLSPLVPDSENEMKKFLLLPEGADHDVPIFYSMPHRKRMRSVAKESRLPWILPHPPPKFIGREVDMYKLLQAVRSPSRLIRLTGPSGIGKVSLAAAVCQYVNSRRSSFFIEEIIWLPLIQTARADRVATSFHRVLEIIQNESDATNMPLHDGYGIALGAIIDELHETKALMVIDTKLFLCNRRISDKLAKFLGDLFRGTKHLKVIVVSREESSICEPHSCIESTVSLGPLSLEATSMLFGVASPYVSEGRYSKVTSPWQLTKLLVSQGQGSLKRCSKRLSKRSVRLFELIGNGVPTKVLTSARDMSPSDYDELIAAAKRKDEVHPCTSRVELEHRLENLQRVLRRSIRKRNFGKAKMIQDECEELEKLRETFPFLSELRRAVTELKERIDHSISLKDFTKAGRMHQQLLVAEKKVKCEEAACFMFDHAKPSGTNSISANEGDGSTQHGNPRFATRTSLEAQILKLQVDMEVAAHGRNFKRAREVQRSIRELEQDRQYLPSISELESRLDTLKGDLLVAIDSQDFFLAESLHKEVRAYEERIASEKEACEVKFVIGNGVPVAVEKKHDTKNPCDAQNPRQRKESIVGSSIDPEGEYKVHTTNTSSKHDMAVKKLNCSSITSLPFCRLRKREWIHRAVQLFLIVGMVILVVGRICFVDLQGQFTYPQKL